jgi:hypothetical protein
MFLSYSIVKLYLTMVASLSTVFGDSFMSQRRMPFFFAMRRYSLSVLN